MVQWLVPALGSSDSYVQIVFDLALPDEVIKTPWSQAGIKRYIFTAGFTRYNANYFNLAPLDVSDYTFFLPPIKEKIVFLEKQSSSVNNSTSYYTISSAKPR
ncbi:hypothetical protein ACFLXU_05015 [Chloroflexota bacterium]